jgi:hypothetical protein
MQNEIKEARHHQKLQWQAQQLQQQQKNNWYPYRKKLLLTNNELTFYRKLKPVADSHGFVVLSKIRIADYVEVIPGTSYYKGMFGKISQKHVDFALARPDNLQIEYLIELDDVTHTSRDRRERDQWVNGLYATVGYKIIHTYGDTDEIEKLLEPFKMLTK